MRARPDDRLDGLERVAAPRRLLGHDLQVGADRGVIVAKAIELRMAPITLRLSRQHLLREQSLAPERNQSGRIEIARMDRPEPHSKSVST
jgi:hypothetical protein